MSLGENDHENNAYILNSFFKPLNPMTDENEYTPFILGVLNEVRVRIEEQQRLTTIEAMEGRETSEILDVPISLRELKAFGDEHRINIADRFVFYPIQLLADADDVLGQILRKELPPDFVSLLPTIRASLHDNPFPTSIHELTPHQVDSVVTIEGVIIRASNVKPLMSEAAFDCTATNPDGTPHCDFTDRVKIIGAKVTLPSSCQKCRRNTMQINYHKCTYQNRQVLKIQDTSSKDGTWSQNEGMIAFVHDPLTDKAKPGQRVYLTGLYRVKNPKLRPTTRMLKALSRVYLDVLHLETLKNNPSAGLLSIEEATLRSYTDRATLIKAFAPGLQMLDTVKLGLLCSLVGGSQPIGDHQAMGDNASIHVLLCGDPATAKSQLLGAVKKAAERSVYVCGRGSSAAGLTASVVRDAETNEFLLEPGAVVIADRGHCLLDEFDKIDEGARTVLNEVMEQQTVSVAKAGIVCSLNARTTIVGSANPIASRFDKRRSIMDNINMPLSLLSRFDLVFLLVDQGDIDYDKQISRSLLQHYSNAEDTILDSAEEQQRQVDTIKRFVEICRHEYHPIMTQEAKKTVQQVYTQMRHQGNTVVTPRQLKALIRIAQAMAKLEWAEAVTPEHVLSAKHLIVVSNDYLSHKQDEDVMTIAKSFILQTVQERGVAGLPEGELMALVTAIEGVTNEGFYRVMRMLRTERLLLTRTVGTQVVVTPMVIDGL